MVIVFFFFLGVFIFSMCISIGIVDVLVMVVRFLVDLVMRVRIISVLFVILFFFLLRSEIRIVIVFDFIIEDLLL